MEEPTEVCKIVLAGDSDVGKSFLSSRYIHNVLPSSPAHTIGVEFTTKTVAFKPSGSAKLQLWDVAGMERYRSMTSMCFRSAAGVVIVFDLTQASTFQSVSAWLEHVRHSCDPNPVLMLLGNKSDVLGEHPEMRAVTYENAQALANSNGMSYMEVSAVSGVGVREAFEVFLDEVHRRTH